MSDFPYITETRSLRWKIARSAMLLLGATSLAAGVFGSALLSPWREWADFGVPLGFGLMGTALAVWPFATELQSVEYIQRIGFACLALSAATFASNLLY